MGDFAIPNNQREFRCEHCEGKILIPKDLPPTTGPCPHCGGAITSPVPEEPWPAPVETAVPVVVPAPVSPPEPARMDDSRRIELPAKGEISERNRPKRAHVEPPAQPRRSGLVPAMLVLLVFALIGGAIVIMASKELGKNVASPIAPGSAGDPQAREANYIRLGWQKDAREALEGYMAATTVEGKLPFILRPDELRGKIEDFYGGGAILDADTPAAGFSVYDLTEEDRRRGLFLMIYDQPPQFEMKEFFRPLAPMEVQYGVDEADLLLSTVSRAKNFEMDPLRVQAFFKRTPQGLKLDWEIFAQTKYRTFLNFTELPEAGASGIFRVFVAEDVPPKGAAPAGTRTYRLTDPANLGDSARVVVKVDSEAGQALSPINWLGTQETRPITKTATVELKWAAGQDSAELEISRFLCWEFLGLGGDPAAASSK